MVGQDALPLVASHPWSAIVDAKRIIGRMSNDATLIAEAHRHEGRLVPHPRIVRDAFGKQPATAARRAACDTCEPEIAFALHFHASQVSALTQLAADACMDAGSVMTQPQLQAWLHTRHWNATRIEAASASDAYLLVTPTAAACVLVRHMLDRLRTVLGHSQFSIGAITVPAEFDARQRQCTLDAYARAGLTATRVLHEPAAAAIAYGLHTRSDVQYVLVFDMGGGTLDISILYLQYNTFTVISTAGDGHLGGEDVDDCVLRIMESQLNSSDSASYAQACDASHAQEVPLCGPVPLKQQAEAAKIALSHADEAAWSCSVPAELPAADDEDTTLFPAAATMSPGIVRHTISRALFESSCASLWDRVLDPVRRALDAAN
ncbi:MAG: Hsp70 family protein, partial [Methanobacteriota archaeon]